MEVLVEFDYAAQEEDELTLKKGDIISNVSPYQEGWYQGVLDGKKGVFPDNFVKEIEKREKSRDVLLKKMPMNPPYEVRAKSSKVYENFSKPVVLKKAIKKVRVIHTYKPHNEDELNLEVGDILEVFCESEPGWYEGSLNGQKGLFPSNFVEIIEENLKSEPEEEPVKEIKGRKVVGVGFGPKIFEEKVVLKPTNRNGPPTSVAFKNNTSQASPLSKKKLPPSLPKETQKSVLKAKANYDYKAENPDELNLKVGDVIIVLDQKLEDVGWWKGSLNGKIGLFPDNFVELLPAEDVLEKKDSFRPHPPPSSTKPKPKDFKPTDHIAHKKLINSTSYVKDLTKEMNQHQHVNKQNQPEPPCASGDPMNNSSSRQISNNSLAAASVASGPTASSNNGIPPFSNSSSSSSSSYVTLEMFNVLKNDIEIVKDNLEKIKKENEKKLLDLMSEIDKEKKERLSLQVEIDRLRKILQASPLSAK